MRHQGAVGTIEIVNIRLIWLEQLGTSGGRFHGSNLVPHLNKYKLCNISMQLKVGIVINKCRLEQLVVRLIISYIANTCSVWPDAAPIAGGPEAWWGEASNPHAGQRERPWHHFEVFQFLSSYSLNSFIFIRYHSSMQILTSKCLS